MKITIITVGKLKEKLFERCNRRVYKAAEQIMQIGDYRSG